MGMVFGKIRVATVKFQILKSAAGYEIRRYPPCVVAQVTHDPSQTGGDKDSSFAVLAGYIGASYFSGLARPQNTKPEKIAMTAPVITSSAEAEQIAMTAPVMTSSAGAEQIAMTVPVFTNTGEAGDRKSSTMVTMQFVLPSKYARAEDAPKPTDERVVLREVGEKIYGAVSFQGAASDSVVEKKVKLLNECLEKDGYKVIGEFVLGRYNPPWTLPPFRTNEVMIPIELVEIN